MGHPETDVNFFRFRKEVNKNGFYEIVLTGVDIASYVYQDGDNIILLSDLCKRLIQDVPEIKRLRLSSVDPAVPDIQNIIELIKSRKKLKQQKMQKQLWNIKP